MKAKIIEIRSSVRPEIAKTPNLGLECEGIFLGIDNNKYYLLKPSEYTKLGDRKSPSDPSFERESYMGFTCEIESEIFSGDRIVTDLNPIKTFSTNVTITQIPWEDKVSTPNLGLSVEMIFEDKDGRQYYLLHSDEYRDKLGGRRTPATYGMGSFTDQASVGDVYEIKYEDFSGDQIVIGLLRFVEKQLQVNDRGTKIIQGSIYQNISSYHKMETPNLGLECEMIFEDKNRVKYFLLQPSEYALKMKGRMSPASEEFRKGSYGGYTWEIEFEFEEYAGDRIVTKLISVKNLESEKRGSFFDAIKTVAVRLVKK